MASKRAFNTGSPGEAKGSLSIMTHDNASPLTSTPSQKLEVPNNTALPASLNCSSSNALGRLPCINSGYFNSLPNISAA